MEMPDIDVSSLKVASNILEDKQDKLRTTNTDTTHLSEAQQDLNKLIDYYEQ